MSITIKTALHEGIYRSHGGGQTRTHYEWNTGPRNLMKAADLLETHRKEMDEAYGNVGHKASWIEVDGVQLREETIMDLDPEICPNKTRTETAREIIQEAKSGVLDEHYRRNDEVIEGERRRMGAEIDREIEKD